MCFNTFVRLILNNYILCKENVHIDTKPMTRLVFSVKITNKWLQENKYAAEPSGTGAGSSKEGESKYMQNLLVGRNAVCVAKELSMVKAKADL
jgi:hypothetical protein